MTEIARFRIRPECVDAALADFKGCGVEPYSVVKRDDGAIAVEFRGLTEPELRALAVAFRPEHSAIVGIIGGFPLEDKNA